jgi:hypothetical protein
METMEKFDELLASELPDIEKLKETFALITQSYLTHSVQEIELLKAMGDQENLVKEQIKHSTVLHVSGVFEFCYSRVTGKQVSDE